MLVLALYFLDEMHYRIRLVRNGTLSPKPNRWLIARSHEPLRDRWSRHRRAQFPSDQKCWSAEAMRCTYAVGGVRCYRPVPQQIRLMVSVQRLSRLR